MRAIRPRVGGVNFAIGCFLQIVFGMLVGTAGYILFVFARELFGACRRLFA